MPAPISLALPAWLDEAAPPGGVFADADAQVGLAIALARRNVEERSGGPFGAAIFDGDGRLVAAGVNRVLPEACSIAHAEMMAFMAAQARLGRARLNEDGTRYVLATSAQPCCQCYGASFWAGIDELRIGARASDVMELSEFDEGPLPADWPGELERRGIAVVRDVLREEAREVFRLYARAGGATY
ncbi:nucleoside deaminase [Dokdonella fugitiva]|jgi:tRNA(Arg) A34 adenosine deaminase TadA|uniref:nucleoside deaminase n=1 Tax=Dokdonella fugitiva TaxID=328517 RepID=UPI0015FB8B60|nr:nucleoside deaminase [Dokdonella fugitiva]MBA8884560.1 tRNA(Arg) A34 adenosine deaminase TadA [Dokdonella fugitiva]